jgi:hypothetical protein
MIFLDIKKTVPLSFTPERHMIADAKAELKDICNMIRGRSCPHPR